jgi:hypothetical protein
VGRRLTLIVLLGAAAIAAAWYAPSWVDQRQSPQVVLSAHVVNFGRVPVSTPVEHLLTVRNSGHTSLTAEGGGGGTLFDFAAVCPKRLGAHERMLHCGFSIASADECQTLKPGASCAVAIQFVPRTPRPYHGRYCFAYAATKQAWRRTETCLTVTGKGARGGKSRPAR